MSSKIVISIYSLASISRAEDYGVSIFETAGIQPTPAENLNKRDSAVIKPRAYLLLCEFRKMMVDYRFYNRKTCNLKTRGPDCHMKPE